MSPYLRHSLLSSLADLVHSDRWRPYWGWHDDHRGKERTAEYRPAMQQVRAEFGELFKVLIERGLGGGSCLQLGLGHCRASHEAFKLIFDQVYTIDQHATGQDVFQGNTHSRFARNFALEREPFNFIFIDAGHSLNDIAADFGDYAPLLISGGIVAVHDACKRPGYEDEIQVWKWMEDLGSPFQMIGTEVGIAWMVKP